MPAGTPPRSVLAAARNFLREEFALRHRYAFVLHTDEPHPHVHAVVKAVSEQGVRLHIKKATLREWRFEFARHLREQGIEANATERAVRGESRSNKIDGVYRPMTDPRRYSTQIQKRTQSVTAELLTGDTKLEPGKKTLIETRKDVERGWRAVSSILSSEGQPELAAQVSRFVDQMSPPRTDKEQLAADLLARVRDPRVQNRPIMR
jgi:hypothetical protein